MNDVCRPLGLTYTQTALKCPPLPPPLTGTLPLFLYPVNAVLICVLFFNRLVVVVLKMTLLFRQRSIQKSNKKHKRVVPSLDIPATVWLTENHLTQPMCLQLDLTNLIISSWGYVNQQFAYT